MGGHIAIAVAERAPSRVERVAVIDTYGDEGLLKEPTLAGAACRPVVGAALDRFRGVDAIVESSLQTGFADDFPVPDFAHRSLEQLTQRGLCQSDAAAELNSERAVADRLAALGNPCWWCGATATCSPRPSPTSPGSPKQDCRPTSFRTRDTARWSNVRTH